MKHCIRLYMSANSNVLKLQQRGLLQDVFPEAKLVILQFFWEVCCKTYARSKQPHGVSVVPYAYDKLVYTVKVLGSLILNACHWFQSSVIQLAATNSHTRL